MTSLFRLLNSMGLRVASGELRFVTKRRSRSPKEVEPKERQSDASILPSF